MKTKSLLLAFAGLGLFACTNEDLKNGIDGNATVTVNFENVVSRAIQDPSTGTDGQKFPVKIESATITLEAGAVKNPTQEITDFDEPVTFIGVRNPKKISVTINGGTKEAMILDATKVNSNLAAPMYDESTDFKRESETKYTVTLTPKHRMARLQFSGIKHKVEGDGSCIYDAMTLDGLFLNNVAVNENTSDVTMNVDDLEVQYVWSDVKTWSAPIFDGIGDNNFLTNEIGWPKAEEDVAKCYGYNIFPAGVGQKVTELPKLTLCCSGVALKPGVVGPNPETGYRFARVSKYVDNEGHEIKAFEAGKIYNITGLSVSDEDFGDTPEGGKDAILTAIVEVENWTLVNGSVEWN